MCSLPRVLQICGSRPHDTKVLYLQFKRCRNGEVFGFFGVFDGHGGPGAARYVRDNLFVSLEQDKCFPNDMYSALSAFLSLRRVGWNLPTASVCHCASLQWLAVAIDVSVAA